ncbi:MAG TPA: AI-2E family transporter [Candidatus Cybelea sp.]
MLALFVAEDVIKILARIRVVVYILVAAVFLAYLIYPAIQWLRRRMPLIPAILVTYIAMLATFAVVATFIVPHIMDDVSQLVRHYPDLVNRLHSMVYDPRDPLTARMPGWVRRELARAPLELAAWVQTRGLETAGQIVVVLAGTAAAVAIFIIVPMVTAYLFLDLDNLKGQLAAVVPEERWRATVSLLSDIDSVIGGFIRGQLLVAVVVGVLITAALALLRVPYPFLFGLLAGVGDLIPYVGAVLAYLPAVLSAVLANGWLNALLVTVAFVLIYEVEGHLIAPPIVGRQVRLSPFVVVIALLIGAELAGLFGMLIAVPVVGVLRVIMLRVLRAAKAP